MSPQGATNPASTSSTPPRGDEVTPIAQYMVGEMNTNAHSLVARRIHELNSFSSLSCIEEWRQRPWWQQFFSDPGQCIDREWAARAAAFTLWTEQVMQGAPWDHKVIIPSRFNPANPSGEQHWHHQNGTLYFFDIWSNIHYGYVGAACGFSESTLLDGAGLEQIGSDISRGRWPSSQAGVSGMRSFDDPSDRTSIAIGIRLWPTAASVNNVMTAIRANHASLSTRSYP